MREIQLELFGFPEGLMPLTIDLWSKEGGGNRLSKVYYQD
jgi:hypothetical protein